MEKIILKTYKLLALSTFIAVSLNACATGPSADDCASLNWEVRGFENGASNNGHQAFERLSEQCLKHGISPDRTAYDRGYARGLNSFCTPSGGFSAGSRGQSLNRADICPTQTRPEFLIAYSKGKKLNDLQNAFAYAKKQLQHAYNDIDRSRQDIKKYSRRIKKLDSNHEDYQKDLKNLRKYIANERKGIRHHKNRLPQLEHSLRIAEDRYLIYHAEMAKEGWL